MKRVITGLLQYAADPHYEPNDECQEVDVAESDVRGFHQRVIGFTERDRFRICPFLTKLSHK